MNKLHYKYITHEKAINLLTESFNLGFHMKSNTYNGQLLEDNNLTVSIKKKAWGGFTTIVSSVKLDSTNTLSKTALIGNKLSKDYCLYIKNNNSYLSITGNTKIKGDCYLPEKGVKLSYVEGKSYLGKKLIFGKTFQSKSVLPKINNYFIQENTNKLNGVFNPEDSIIYTSEIEAQELSNSFKNKTWILKSNTPIILNSSWNVNGNIIIYSNQKITVKAGVKLNNIVLYSPRISIEENVKGSFQVVANKSIYIANNVTLEYPSLVFALGDSSVIDIKENTIIEGGVLSIAKGNFLQKKNKVNLAKNSTIKGLAYCNNALELKGNVYGKVICDKLTYRSPSTSYTNQLIDVTIDNSKLPDFFSTTPILKPKKTPEVKIIQWLD